ncbi:MAG: TrkA family potassium uptake protein [Actinomycetes bacterium]
MHIVIMGCGRVGSRLAIELSDEGQSVTVIDQNPNSFQKLGRAFTGKTIAAVGYDRDALIEAGIARASAFVAVSNGDNSNIIAARVARETFGVQNVVARIYDPRRAEIYERLGIPTVATVAWAAGQIMRRLNPAGAIEEWRDATNSVVLAEFSYHPDWIGHPAFDVTARTGARAAFITRYGQAIMADRNVVLQEGDLLHILCHPNEEEVLIEIASAPPWSA